MMVVFHKARKLWVFPQHILCALLNLQVIPSWFQQILCWLLFLGAPMLILCSLLVFRCLLYGSIALLAWGEGALVLMFLLVSLESFSLLLLVRLSPSQEEREDYICQKETIPIPVHVVQRKAASLAARQELSRKQSLSKPQRHLSQVLPPLARQIACAEDLAKIEQKTPSEAHRARSIPIDHIPTILLNLPRSHAYMLALRNKNKQSPPITPSRYRDI
jgi:hypothetical protein